jgi:hypothetical protein
MAAPDVVYDTKMHSTDEVPFPQRGKTAKEIYNDMSVTLREESFLLVS